VRDRYHDQLERSGHANRLEDLERFAGLGIQAIRYPVLWERVAPRGPKLADWTWPDARLSYLRALGIRPIVGLLHHGSGPRYTDLLDPEFPEKLAVYARAVAERYPWVIDWTPINEPLTTARFSALYGHWYPHLRDDRAFIRALVHQTTGITRAMEEIRAVNPDARLVQTEDMGRTYATRALAYQADFENDRRWASFDLLCGTLEPGSPFGTWARAAGLSEADLAWSKEHLVRPAVIGLDHYPTSQRWLDERLDHYPGWSHGGNGRDRYADVEAVRARGEGIAPTAELLHEAYERYGIPVAVSECHIWSTREQQMRWLYDTWNDCVALRERGVDVRAVTIWAALGTYDWDSCVVRETHHYEPGAFDMRGGHPRPTAIATLARELISGREPSHPALVGPRWWRSPERLTYGDERAGSSEPRSEASSRILVLGSGGRLGRAFVDACARRGLSAVGLRHTDVDIADDKAVRDAVARERPWAIVNAAGYVRVDDAEDDPRCDRDNAVGALNVALAAVAVGAQLVTFSSDLVFDGRKQAPYVESDVVAPLSAYGRSKVAAERYVAETYPSSLVVRTSAFFGPTDPTSFVAEVMRAVREGRQVKAANDVVVSPTYIPDLVDVVLDLIIDGESGLWHLANADALTWAELAERAAALAGLDDDLVRPTPARSLAWTARRPPFSALASERAYLLPSLDDALTRYALERVVGAP
jgi:dTDP-4-dehydrorhamnose reductase